MMRRKLAVGITTLVIALSPVALPLVVADDAGPASPANTSKANPAKAPMPAAGKQLPLTQPKIGRRLPSNFGDLGLSPVQREQIYQVQASYDSKAAQLKLELENLNAEKAQRVETILSPEQKAHLHQLREQSKAKANAKKLSKAN